MGYKNWTIIYPPKDYQVNSYGCFHAKLWLLKFPNFLRVVISTGNQHVPDWTTWSNALWYQDFPLKSANNNLNNSEINKSNTFEKIETNKNNNNCDNNTNCKSNININSYNKNNNNSNNSILNKKES